MRARLPRLLAWALLSTALLGTAGPAMAADTDADLAISHVEPGATGDKVQILVSVPSEAEVDLDAVSVSLNGTDADATAELAAEGGDQLERTTILAIDTSDSMAANGRFAAAKVAATTFLDTVPDDVEVGIVTFDAKVTTRLEPTSDHDAAAAVLAELTLAQGTLLNDGVIRATQLAGTEGARTVLVLSDGADTSRTPLSAAEKAITEAGVEVDVVALDQAGSALAPLRAMSVAGEGDVVSADPEALTAAFEAEADSLARQVLVTATIPDEVTAQEATISVSFPAGGSTLVAQSFTIIRDTAAPPPPAAAAPPDASLQLPKTAMYGGMAAIGLGLLVFLGGLMVMATAGSGPRTVEDRIAAYGAAGSHAGNRHADSGSALNLDQAKDAAASMLRRNKGLEARIEARLEAAGSAFKPSEWLLMHGAIAILGGLVGLLVGGGSIWKLLLCLGLGVAVPWLWLGRRKKKRVNAFNSGLADTLQLIAGSLSAGMSLAQSLDSVVNEGSQPIAGEFQRVLIEARLGVPLEDALEGISTRIESKDFEWVVMAIRIQREVGGNLAELLTTVASTLRERDYLRRQVKTLSAEGRLSAYILCGLPIFVVLYLLTLRPEYIMPLFTTAIGLLLVVVAVILLSLGAWMMNAIAKVEV